MSHIALGARRVLGLVFTALLAVPPAAQAAPQFVLPIVNPAPEDFDAFGSVMAGSKGRFLIGAPFDLNNGPSGTAFFVTILDETSYSIDLLPDPQPPPNPFDTYFPESACFLSPNRFVVGVPNNTASVDGRFDIFDVPKGGPPVRVDSFVSPNSAAPSADSFGVLCVCGKGGLIGVTTPDFEPQQMTYGRAQTFRKKGKKPAALVDTFVAGTNSFPGAATQIASVQYARFGSGLAFSGRSLIVGAAVQGEDLAQPPMYVQVHGFFGFPPKPSKAPPTLASVVQDLPPTDSSAGFPSVTMVGRDVVLATPYAPNGAEFSVGEVTIFVRKGKSFTPVTIRPPPGDVQTGLVFGEGIAAFGNTLYVGAPGFNNAMGRVYVYEKKKGVYSLESTLDYPLPTEPGESPYFGGAIATSGKNLIGIAAPYANNGPVVAAGNVLIFQN